MSNKYKNIFKPCVLKNGVILKNRICYSNGQQTFNGGPVNGPAEAMITDLGIFARSGASLMNWGHFGPMGGGARPRTGSPINKKDVRARGERFVQISRAPAPGSAASFDYDDGRTWNLLGQAAQAAHLYDTRLIVKLGAAFPKGISLNGIEEKQERMIWPLPLDDERYATPPLAMDNPLREDIGVGTSGLTAPDMETLKKQIATREQIEDCIEDVVDMCVRYMNAGFDGMSLRGDRWGLNASTNIREDEYNGEIEARGLFQYQLYKRIKEVCGDRFLIEVVMPGSSDHGHDGQLPSGYTEEEFIRFMKLVEDVIDIVEIREPTGIGYQCMAYNSQPGIHSSLDIARHLREAGFSKTIAVNGGYHDPDEMEQIISEGIVDLVSTARSFRAEPEFLEKLRSDGREVPTPCLRCNKCHGSWDSVNICSVNPRDSLNHRIPLIVREPKTSKKVAVIGGGLIGMRAASFAAERGHSVTVFERSSLLGGKAAYYAPLYPGKWTMDKYLKWCIDELSRRGVTDIRLNTEPDPEDITAEGFDAVIACTGSREKRPPISGADAEGVLLNEDIYYGNAEAGKSVIIVGGGDVSTETAMYLASIGKDVTVLTRQDVLMIKQFYAHGPHMSYTAVVNDLGYGGNAGCWTAYDNLKPVLHAQTLHVTPHSVTYLKDNSEITIKADTVIVSGGYKPCAEDALKYADCTDEFYMAGDCRVDSDCLFTGNAGAYGRAVML